MQDMRGREIEVGDEIAYASTPYGSARLTIGIVDCVDTNKVRVTRQWGRFTCERWQR